MPESPIQSKIMLDQGSRPDVRLFRNNIGNGFFGKLAHLAGKLILTNLRRVKFGLYIGSGDLIGWKSIIITPEMIGQRIAVFTSIEVKDKYKKPTPEQNNWREAVIKFGGIAGTAWSVEDAQKIVRPEGVL